MRTLFGGIVLLLLSTASVRSEKPKTLHSFDRLQLSDQFYCEGATFLDVNRDGAMDIVSGPYWYAGPKFLDRSEIYSPVPFDIADYSENFFAFSHDVNNDDWTDVVVVGFPGKEALWYQNPQGKTGHWQRHVIHPEVDNESPHFTDLTGDGEPDLVFHTGGKFGYATMPDDPTKPWEFHAISPDTGNTRFTHGLGVGDVNGDGRADILEKTGWWEQPPTGTNGEWKHHSIEFSRPGGAQMFAYDVDGDGDNDVISSKHAHAYGLAWFENTGTKEGEIEFREHKIMGERPEENDYGVVFSQLHALALIDMDGDGLLDIVTGKRYWAHAEHDAGALEPAVLYWFQMVRDGGKVSFVPHRIDVNSGVGTQVVAGDINGDKLSDIVVGNKKGTFVFLHRAEPAVREKAERVRLKPDPYTLHSFDRIQLANHFFCEGGTFADVNRDGIMDVVAGPYWYAGPKFLEKTEIYTPATFDVRNFSDNFFAFPYDLNDDDWTDIVVVGFPGKEAYWYQNPRNKSGHWKRHLIHEEVDNESPHFTDLTGDGRPELVFHTGGQFGYMEIPSDPTEAWEFHPISGDLGITRFTHGLGIGDLNSDGRNDVIEKTGWWEQPLSASSKEWIHHPVEFAQEGGAQMYAYDVDGDGDKDVITSKHAHGFGLAWFESETTGDGISFREHSIMGERADENEYGVTFSKLHAMELADVDQDGIMDIITGRRPSAPSNENATSPQPAVLYWFKTVRDGSEVSFIPHRIDLNSGVGTQLVSGDANGDNLLDLVVANKRGTFVFIHHAEPVDRQKWGELQPKRRLGSTGSK